MAEEDVKPRKPGTFQPGDPRINTRGRPKTFDGLRTLAQSIAHEPAKNREGEPLVINGKIVTVGEAILRQWASSKSPHLTVKFMEYAFGKPPTDLELGGKGGGPVVVEVVYTNPLPSADPDAA